MEHVDSLSDKDPAYAYSAKYDYHTRRLDNLVVRYKPTKRNSSKLQSSDYQINCLFYSSVHTMCVQKTIISIFATSVLLLFILNTFY